MEHYEPNSESRKIFEQAIEIESADQREQFVVNACKGNEPLLAIVQQLLNAHAQSPSALGQTADFEHSGDPDQEELAVSDNTIDRPSASAIARGTAIGPYKLLQQIGEGGMGAVWMAEQEKPVRRRVAVKLIRGDIGNPDTIARFEAERQALALMDHQNIAL